MSENVEFSSDEEIKQIASPINITNCSSDDDDSIPSNKSLPVICKKALKRPRLALVSDNQKYYKFGKEKSSCSNLAGFKSAFTQVECLHPHEDFSSSTKQESQSAQSNETVQTVRRSVSPLNITNCSSDDDAAPLSSNQMLQLTCKRAARRTRLPLVCIERKNYKAGKENVEMSPNTISAHVESQEDSSDICIDQCSSSSDADTPKSTQISDGTTTSENTERTPLSELDVFLALIERECKSDVTKTNSTLKRRKERFRKGGFVEYYLRTQKSARAETKFLQHDKKYGLQVGVQVQVLSLLSEFGVHLARVQELATQLQSSTNKNCFILLSSNMARNVKAGSQLEVFFNTDTKHTYQLRDGDGVEQLYYIMPHKVLLAT